MRKIDIGQFLGIPAFVLALITAAYLVFGPTISVTKSETIVKDRAGVGTVGKVVSGTTSSYAAGDRELLFIAGGIVVAAFLGALFAWRRMGLAVIVVGILLVIFSLMALFSIGLFVLPVGFVFLAAGVLCLPVRPKADWHTE